MEIEGLAGAKSVTYKRRCKGRKIAGKDGRSRWRCEHGDKPCRWAIVVYVGYVVDPVTGNPKPQQRWLSFKGTEDEVKARRDEVATKLRTGEFIEPSKMTLGTWLDTWLAERVKPALRPTTHESYAAIVAKHLAPALGSIPLQTLRPGHITQYYLQRQSMSRASLDVHHAILTGSLTAAVKQGLAGKNVASLAEGRPRAKDGREEAKRHCWSAENAVKFLAAADDAGQQLSALFALAIDTGMRKGELLGLPWSALNLDAATVTVDRTLLEAGREPKFGPTKTGKARTIDLTTETVRRLAMHKRVQAELRMRNRTAYHDLGLVFAKEWGDMHGREDSLGLPLQINNFGEREFTRVCKAADVPRIKFHGLRHTSATLLLAAGEPAHVVAARLGHAKVTTTLEIYAHALPAHGQQAARTMGNLLYPTGTAAQKRL